MYCRKCGKEINEDLKFCGNCGDDRTTPFEKDAKKVKVASALAYVSILFFLPLVMCPDSKKGRFHANQGLVLLITNFIISIAASVLILVFTFMIMSQAMLFDIEGDMTVLVIGIVGELIVSFALLGAGIFLLVVQIMGIVAGAQGVEKKLPFIGRFKILK